MKNKIKWLTLPVSLLVLHCISGCAMPYPTPLQDVSMGNRTLPEGSTVTFENLHAAPLNPALSTPYVLIKTPGENEQYLLNHDVIPPATANTSVSGAK